MKTVIEATNISVVLGGQTLIEDLSLTVNAGEVLALVGPNGAGKSTLLSALAGDLPLRGGELRLDGRPIQQYRTKELATRRAVLPQQTVLTFAFTARQVVEMGRGIKGRRGNGDHEAVETAMDRTETAEFRHRVYPSLSGGEQTRVSLARVLAQETPLLLLDEPTAALDLRHQELVMSVAKRLAGLGAAVVVVLHDLNLAAAHADRIAILHRGRLVRTGTPWEALEAEVLSQTFGCPVAVSPHPLRDAPLILPKPSSHS